MLQLPTGLDIPALDGSIVVARQNRLTVMRERDTLNDTRLGNELTHLLTRGDLPDTRRRAAQHIFSIGRKRDACQCFCIPGELAYLLTGGRVPDSCRLIGTSCNNKFTIQ